MLSLSVRQKEKFEISQAWWEAVYTETTVPGSWSLGRGSNELGKGSNELSRGSDEFRKGSIDFGT